MGKALMSVLETDSTKQNRLTIGTESQLRNVN